MRAIELARKMHEKRKKYFDELDGYLSVIKSRVKKLIPDCEVYLFGSVVEKKVHPLSDIDVAIVSDNIPKKPKEIAELKLKILEGFEFSPFELHLLSRSEWDFYKNFSRTYRKV